MQLNSKETIDSILEGFGPLVKGNEEPIKTLPITFWLPEEYKMKYELIQNKSKRKLGKLLQKVLMKSIDKIDLESLES